MYLLRFSDDFYEDERVIFYENTDFRQDVN